MIYREKNPIVVEGAASIAELNLRQTDLVNLGLARHLNIPVLLVADIDRGGVFASIYGTIALLDREESSPVRAFAVNRFRGDPALFANATEILEEKAGKPCLGVFPMSPICRSMRKTASLSITGSLCRKPAYRSPFFSFRGSPITPTINS